MGANEVRNYYGSWNEWGNAAETPVMKPAKPKECGRQETGENIRAGLPPI